MLAVALAVAAAGCGGSGAKHRAARVKAVTGEGFVFAAPAGWRVERRGRTVTARSGGSLLSVTVFALPHPFRPSLWAKAVSELDRVAGELAAREGAKLNGGETIQVAGRRARSYVFDHAGKPERIGFVLDGRREFQLFCHAAGDACDRMFTSFMLLPVTPSTVTLP